MKLDILIIEDESLVALHIKKIILSLGHNVVAVAKSASKAYKIAQEENIDLVISDINIDGDEDGVECTYNLRKTYDVQVIFLTAYKDISTLEKVARVEFIAYLIKPFREDELITLINLILLKKIENLNENVVIIDEVYSYCYDTNKLLSNLKPIELTKKEQLFILALLHEKDSVVSYKTLENKVWAAEPTGDSTRRQLVHRLKLKASALPIEMIKGLGYKLTFMKKTNC